MQGGLIGSICFLAFLLAIEIKAQTSLRSTELKSSGLVNHQDKNNLTDSQLVLQRENTSLPVLNDQATAKGQLLEEITPPVFEGDQYRALSGYNARQYTDNSPNILANLPEPSLKDEDKFTSRKSFNVDERRSAEFAYAPTDKKDSKFQVLANSHEFEIPFGSKVNQYFDGLGYPNSGDTFVQSETIKGTSNPYNSGLPGQGQAYEDTIINNIQGRSLMSEQTKNYFGPESSGFDGFSFGSVDPAFNSKISKNPSVASSRLIPQNELILLHQIPGSENAIKCTEEGEMHNLWIPPHQCMVCACINQGRYIQPICTSCAGCMNSKYANMQKDTLVVPSEDLTVPFVQEPPSQINTQVSCDPLPMNRPFQNPLNPCQICVCRGNNALDDIEIICQENPQCVIPPDIAKIPPIPVPPAPVPLPTCAQLPKNVMFPHPQDRCKICKCINHSSQFGSTEPQVICVPRPECGARAPETHVATPANSLSPNLVPYPNSNLSPNELVFLNPELFPGQLKPPTSETEILPAQPGPNLVDVQLMQDLVPYSPPSQDGSEVPREKIPAQSGSEAIILEEETQVPIPWPTIPKEPGQIQGPLPGPPPHDSCKPFSPNTPFQHPWDYCQNCVCSEFHSSGHTTIEVNCYTKPSCCVERRITSESISGSKTKSLPPPVPSEGQLHITDKICEFKSFGAEFVNSRDNCQLCTCELFGSLVVPICKRLERPECLTKPDSTPSIKVVYIEPKCKQRLPHQPFHVNCNTCVCLPVYNFVIAKCTLRPECRKLPGWPGIGLGTPVARTTPKFIDFSGGNSQNIAKELKAYQFGQSHVVESPSKPQETLLMNQLLMNNQAATFAKSPLPGIQYLPANSVLGLVPQAQTGSRNLWSEVLANKNSITLKDNQYSQNPLLQSAHISTDALAANAANQYKNYNLIESSVLSQSHASIVPGSQQEHKRNPTQSVPVLSPTFYSGGVLQILPSGELFVKDDNSNQYSYLYNTNQNSPNVYKNQGQLEILPTYLKTTNNYKAQNNVQFLEHRPSESYKNVDKMLSSGFQSLQNPADRYITNNFYSNNQKNLGPEVITASDVYETALYPTTHRQETPVFQPGRNPWSGSAQAIAKSSTLDGLSTQNYAQVQINTGTPKLSGRGKCQYDGDMYHEKCQACYCSRDSNGKLNSICLGNPCTN